MTYLIRGVLLFTIIALPVVANADSLKPDDHAPAGVKADHIHKKDEWMLSYRYSKMRMEGNRDGNNDVSNTQVRRDFVVAPLDMTMQMHMFGLMYAPTDDFTLMAMVPWVYKEMNHVNRMNVFFETKTDGIGDVKVSGLYKLYSSQDSSHGHPNRAGHQLHLQAGLSIPTGSTQERADTPAGTNQKLPYPMQLGSGTIDPILGLTYLYKLEDWSFGAQANTTLRVGKNEEGYRLGNEFGLTSWVARNLTDYASVSFRLEGNSWGDIHGQDDELNILMVPTARTDLRGGKRVDALVGINLYQSKDELAGHRLSFEVGAPVYQHLDGPQLETDWRYTLSWQWAF